LQQEAGFVEEDQVGPAAPGPAADAAEVAQPALDLLVVALLGRGVGPLRASVQAALEQLADVFGVEGDVEVAADHLGDALDGPEAVGPAMGPGPLAQQGIQLSQLGVAQARRQPGMGLGGQAWGTRLGHLAPAVQGVAVDAKDAGNSGGGFALFDECHGPTAAAFEFGSGSKRSAHTRLDAPKRRTIL
jgi:hypothetical protein